LYRHHQPKIAVSLPAPADGYFKIVVRIDLLVQPNARLSEIGQNEPPNFVAATAELPSIADAGEHGRRPP
jgi:hypothetical protein